MQIAETYQKVINSVDFYHYCQEVWEAKKFYPLGYWYTYFCIQQTEQIVVSRKN
jgi:hypothetical protein